VFSRWDYWEYRRWRRRRRRRVAYLLAIAFLLVAGAAAHATSAQSSHGNRVPSKEPGSTVTHHRPARAVTKARTHREGIRLAGDGLRWTDFYGIELPGSAKDGPLHARRSFVWGFADTPGGALVAAINIGVRTAALWGPAIYGPTIRNQVTGPDKAALLAADTSDYAALRAAGHVPPGRPAGRGYAAEAGFRFLAYAPAAATLDVVAEGPSTSGAPVLVATRIEVLWRDGDWRVVAPPGGDWANSATTVPSLTAYTTFANEG
jgi:hypothetical protein